MFIVVHQSFIKSESWRGHLFIFKLSRFDSVHDDIVAKNAPINSDIQMNQMDPALSDVQFFMSIVNDIQSLTKITKSFILDRVGFQNPHLNTISY